MVAKKIGNIKKSLKKWGILTKKSINSLIIPLSGEQIKQMVIDGSPRRISSYLHRWSMWWARTSEHWDYQSSWAGLLTPV